MLRQKKKQLNLKPNRVLDKRSSRGMLYENEELRLRTIHINDEVDKSHHDVKKLRKENEYLKREIWSLRDECEKLEEVIKKVYNGELPPADQLPKYQPRLRKQSTISSKWDPARRGSCLSFSQYSFYDEDEDTQTQNDDDDGQSYDERGQLTRQNSTMSYQGSDCYSEDSSKPLIFVSEEFPEGSDTPRHVPHHLQWQMHSPELEAVTEESENSISPNPFASENSAKNLNEPPGDIRFIDSSRATSVTSEQQESMSESIQFYNPVIEITPASSSSTPTNIHTTPTPPIAEPSERTSVGPESTPVDLGCVSLIGEKYESELKISTAPSADLPEQQQRKISQESAHSQNEDKQNHCSSFSLNSQSQEHPAPSQTTLLPQIPSILSRKNSLFHSEPSLNLLKFDKPQPHRPSSGLDQSVEMCGADTSLFPTWNSVDKNLVVGYLTDELSELSAQEIIDELEVQLDPTLEKIAGVRMLTLPGFSPKRVFISLRTAAGVKLLVDKGLTVRGGERLKLVDASQHAACSLVTLSGLPASFPHSALISLLNQYGQVVAPLERRIYKGVDIAERVVRMHLLRPLPTAMFIGGYQVVCKISEVASSPAHAQQQCIPKGHKPVARAATMDYAGLSTPTTPTTLSPMNNSAVAAARRKISVCSATNAPPNPAPPAGSVKKPLQRSATKSSPGALSQQQQPSQEQQYNMDTRSVLMRSISSDPRRISNASKSPTDGSQLSLLDTPSHAPGHAPVSRQQSKYFPIGSPGQRQLSNASRYILEKKEPLPWCGCWGNGCI